MGESITVSAGAVIVALLSQLVGTFRIYSHLGVPLAIGIVVMLATGLTVLPALLTVFGRAAWSRGRRAGAPARSASGGGAAGRLVQRAVVTLCIGLVVFGGLAVASPGYKGGGSGDR